MHLATCPSLLSFGQINILVDFPCVCTVYKFSCLDRFQIMWSAYLQENKFYSANKLIIVL